MRREKQSRKTRKRQIDRFQLYKPFIFYAGVLFVLHVSVLRSGATSLAVAGTMLLVGSFPGASSSTRCTGGYCIALPALKASIFPAT
jgi:hypothetical protein